MKGLRRNIPGWIAGSMPVTLTDATSRAITVRSAERIIPVDGDLAEIVFALGLGDRVVATNLSATYPPEAAAKPEIGYQRALSAEPILAFSPTVVLATPTAGPAEVIDQLRAVVPTVLIVTTTGLESVGGIDKLLAFPALSRTPVATNRQVFAYEDQYLYGFGPRTGQLLAQLIRDIHKTT